jgi:hypothetical protein
MTSSLLYYGVVLVVPVARLAVALARYFGWFCRITQLLIQYATDWPLALDEFHLFLLVALYVSLCRPINLDASLIDGTLVGSPLTKVVSKKATRSIATAPEPRDVVKEPIKDAISATTDLRNRVPLLVKSFLENVSPSTPIDKDTWRLVATTTTPPLRVYQRIDAPFRYRILGTLHQLPHVVFKFLSDIESRPKWDDMVLEARILQQLDSSTRVIYLRMKPVWPTASRDMVLLSHFTVHKQLDGVDGPVYVNVTQSIDFTAMPERTAEGIVRMHVGVSGQMVSMAQDKKRSLIWQLADGDPRGWIPTSVVNFVATQAVPRSFAKLDRIVASLVPQVEDSERFEEIEDDDGDEDKVEVTNKVSIMVPLEESSKNGTSDGKKALIMVPPTPPQTRPASALSLVHTVLTEPSYGTSRTFWLTSSIAVGAAIMLKSHR